MKKWMTLLLAAAILLGLAACGAGAPEDDAPSESGLHFAAATIVYENEYKADDGTLLLSEHYELPRLELRTADGTLYTAAANLTENTASSGAAAAQVMRAAKVYRAKLGYGPQEGADGAATAGGDL